MIDSKWHRRKRDVFHSPSPLEFSSGIEFNIGHPLLEVGTLIETKIGDGQEDFILRN